MASTYLSPHKKIIFVFSILVFLALAGSVFGLFQTSYQATINITPNPQEIDVNFETQVANGQNKEFLSGKTFQIIKQGEIDKKAEASVSMKDYSEGKIILTNNTWNNINFVAGTRFKSPNGLIYRAVNRIHIPARGQTEILVRADKMGKEYDIGPSIFTIPGLKSSALKENITAKSTSPMTGGIKESGVIMQTDIDNAYKELKEKLYNQATQEIRDKITNSDFELAVNSKTIEKQANATAGDEKTNFKVNMKLNIQAVALLEKDILEYAQKNLEEKIGLGKTLAAIEPNSLSYRLKNYNSEQDKAELEIQLRGYTTINDKIPFLDKSKLKNQNIKEVENYLLSFKSIAKVNIKVWPPFIENKIPNNPEKIKINILNLK
ncbi:MAG TPA: hypothetical protein VJ900_02020 [Patescibacteria group bacterium]|nr:hypothetical protein [Patescibacteria group bacterium]